MSNRPPHGIPAGSECQTEPCQQRSVLQVFFGDGTQDSTGTLTVGLPYRLNPECDHRPDTSVTAGRQTVQQTGDRIDERSTIDIRKLRVPPDRKHIGSELQ